MKNAIAIMTLAVAGAAVAGDIVTAHGVAPSPERTHWVLLLLAALTPLIIEVVKLVIPRIPRVWLPILAPIVGAAVDIILGGAWGHGTVMAAIAGAAGVGLREIADQLRKAAAAARESRE